MSDDQFGGSGIFSALTDFEVKRYATPKLLRILYIIGFVLTLLYALVFFVGALASGEVGLILLALIGVPVITLFALLYVRVGVEVLSVIFQIAGDIRTIATNSGPSAPPTPPAPPTQY